MSKEPVIKAEKFGLTMCGKFNQIERRIKSKSDYYGKGYYRCEFR